MFVAFSWSTEVTGPFQNAACSTVSSEPVFQLLTLCKLSVSPVLVTLLCCFCIVQHFGTTTVVKSAAERLLNPCFPHAAVQFSLISIWRRLWWWYDGAAMAQGQRGRPRMGKVVAWPQLPAAYMSSILGQDAEPWMAPNAASPVSPIQADLHWSIC